MLSPFGLFSPNYTAQVRSRADTIAIRYNNRQSVMDPQRWETIKDLFEAALDLPQSDRVAYLGRACADDPTLQSEVERLLKSHDEAGDFLHQPIIPPSGAIQVGEILLDRYRVIRKLGRGGMGEVYEVHDSSLNELVALKTLRPEVARREDYVRRFKREIQLARKVTHPNICRVFEVGEYIPANSDRSRILFFTMELIRGETLAARIRARKRLPREEAFNIARQMAEGLAAAHELGIVHTDFKSGNVMLSPASGAERVVITDFGLARQDPQVVNASQVETVTASLGIAGTLGYMSPEQLTGGKIGRASDIYSFGIVLYEMATGSMPFDNRHAIKAAVERMGGRVPSAREKTPGLDIRWENAIARCLQPDPQKRFESTSQLADCFTEGSRRLQPPRLTRGEWLRASAAAGVVVAGGTGTWMWLTRPYQPNAEALQWYARGLEALHSMTYETARKTLERAVEADPKFVTALAGLARAYDELDLTDQAKDTMAKAMVVAEDVNLTTADRTRLRAYQFQISPRDHARAAGNYRDLESQASTPRARAEAALEAGWLEQQHDHTPEAYEAYKRAVKADRSYAAAHLRLGFILQRQGKREDAFKSLGEAEKLYETSGNFEGVVEAMLQRATILARRAESAADAKNLISQALGKAQQVGSLHQQIRLRLLDALATRNLGDSANAALIAQQAVETANLQRMDNIATTGLIDLGTSYIARDRPVAEKYLRQALDLATRVKARRNAARAQSNLASALEQTKPVEAKQLIEPALRYYIEGGYRKEVGQAATILGGAYRHMANFSEAERYLTQALGIAVELKDSESEASARERLGGVLNTRRRWPESLVQYTLAATLRNDRAAAIPPLLNARAIAMALGSKTQVEDLRRRSKALLDRPSTEPKYLHDDEKVTVTESYWAGLYDQTRAQIGDFQKRYGPDEDLQILQNLLDIRKGSVAPALASLQTLMDGLLRDGEMADLAETRLKAAEALLAVNQSTAFPTAFRLAGEALDFFSPREIWESVWRCHAVAAGSAPEQTLRDQHRAGKADALEKLRAVWPPEMYNSYSLTSHTRTLLTLL